MTESSTVRIRVEGNWMKRCFDLFVSILILGLSFPVMGLLGLLIRLTMGSKVLFRQARPGLDGKLFTVLKFRSMNNSTDINGHLLDDEERLTALGQLMRRSSLDELPQLWNVFLGEMSLVGPRPLLPEYLPLYNERQIRRHEVLPGITGLAQVTGRNALAWESRLELDVQYVEQQSFQLDMKILWMTIICVWNRSGITHEGHATMPKFSGSIK